MKPGSSDILNAYAGAIGVNNAYLGSDLLWSNIPDAPTNLIATNIFQTTFTLSWTGSSGATGYKIYKNAGLYQDVGNVVTHGITGQTASSSATWTVVAYNGSGDSDPSSGLVVVQSPDVTEISISFPGELSGALACGALEYVSNYKTGHIINIENGDVWYTTAQANIKLDGFGNYFSNGVDSFQISSTGVTSNIATCTI